MANVDLNQLQQTVSGIQSNINKILDRDNEVTALYNVISWIVGIFGGIFTLLSIISAIAIVYVQSANKKVKEKMKEATQKLEEAEKKIEQAQHVHVISEGNLQQLKIEQEKIKQILDSKELNDAMKEVDTISDIAKVLQVQVSSNAYLSEAIRTLSDAISLYQEKTGDTQTIKDEIVQAYVIHDSLSSRIKECRTDIDELVFYDNSSVHYVIPNNVKKLNRDVKKFMEKAEGFYRQYRIEEHVTQ
ncbi:hypothetical protein NSS74_19030 [Bacillus sp. FSL E2-8868]|uniref:hypothetical protein n=1 Tax=Bacillus sp. FSL E2-8868 TaxID=2954598 RepID=UPI0030FB481D